MNEALRGRLVVASVSGGKDSGAMCLWLKEQGIEHRRVFADTGWEHPATYEYLRGELTKALGPIDEVHSGLGLADLCRKKGMFPSRVRRFCTEELKVKPLAKYVRALDVECVNAIGIRGGESLARSKMTEWDWSDAFDCDVWRPLLSWTEQDVIDIHTRHGLRPNPLYLLGARRVGCWPCIMVSKDELRLIADTSPERIDEIRALEKDVTATARARYEAKGETFDSLNYSEPRFFQAAGALRSEGRDGRGVDVDEAVSWSRTARGGKQFELFAPERDGCVRWGLCETET